MKYILKISIFLLLFTFSLSGMNKLGKEDSILQGLSTLREDAAKYNFKGSVQAIDLLVGWLKGIRNGYTPNLVEVAKYAESPYFSKNKPQPLLTNNNTYPTEHALWTELPLLYRLVIMHAAAH